MQDELKILQFSRNLLDATKDLLQTRVVMTAELLKYVACVDLFSLASTQNRHYFTMRLL